MRNHTAGR